MQISPMVIIMDYRTGEYICQSPLLEPILKNQIITFTNTNYVLGEVCPYYKVKCVKTIPYSSDIYIYIDNVPKEVLFDVFDFN